MATGSKLQDNDNGVGSDSPQEDKYEDTPKLSDEAGNSNSVSKELYKTNGDANLDSDSDESDWVPNNQDDDDDESLSFTEKLDDMAVGAKINDGDNNGSTSTNQEDKNEEKPEMNGEAGNSSSDAREPPTNANGDIDSDSDDSDWGLSDSDDVEAVCKGFLKKWVKTSEEFKPVLRLAQQQLIIDWITSRHLMSKNGKK